MGGKQIEYVTEEEEKKAGEAAPHDVDIRCIKCLTDDVTSAAWVHCTQCNVHNAILTCLV